ncbi:alpha/beta fold hydrolase [Phenylobacterium sp.]|uniref:alpha/beta hydrolase family protein n=1 Tax=Phenylobacterium sp. TaxID=1871053 RepID=UPI0012019CE5|nr:alpha/beta fold hydrolase [Phenylobacterium sp.]THD64720.1 MAG: alpha/beta fold hydrolase [Phenylobacterium sp.]
MTTMVRKLTVWIAAMTVALLMMAVVLQSAAHAQVTPPPAQPPPATGSWYGALPIQAGLLRLQVELSAGADGVLAGALASVDQGAAAFPLVDVKAADGGFGFAVPRIQGRFEGRWDTTAGGWRGTWTQPGGTFPILLKPGHAPPRLRPQTPKPPFPYRSEEVAFDSAPGVRLAGTLTLPPGKGPFPAAVLITGSGQQDRDETIVGHKPFLLIADTLTRRGIAVLRLDDRGAGGSTGDFAASTTADFAVDITRAVAFLRTRPDIDPGKIGLIGHSEGGAIGPLVAANDRKIAFVVMLAGPGVTGAETIRSQRRALMLSAGASEAQAADAEAVSVRIRAVAADAKTVAEAIERIHTAAPELPMPQVRLAAAQTMSPWTRFFLAYDPQPALQEMRCPVLALNGSKDQQVVPSVNLPPIRAALRSNADATVIELPGLNHLFQDAPTGSPDEYADIDETLSPAMLTLMADWVVKHAER